MLLQKLIIVLFVRGLYLVNLLEVDTMLQQKEKKPTCNQCKIRLGLMAWTCRCERTFCQAHLAAEEHGCTYDYKSAGAGQLSSIMVAVRTNHGLEKL